MRPQTRHNPSASACSAALLALSVAVCLGGAVAGPALSGSAAAPPQGVSVDRRLADEHGQVVEAILACLSDVAKHLAGSTPVVVQDRDPALTLPPRPSSFISVTRDEPTVCPLPHVSLLDLPPPAATPL